MIRAKLKKFAQENGLQLDAGVAYGSLQGFAATLSQGGGYVQLFITTRFPVESKYQAFRAAVEQQLQKQYQVQELLFVPDGINVIFFDNPGIVKKVAAFADWFLPLLNSYGASRADLCLECGMPVENGTWILRDDVAAYHMHSDCAQKAVQAAEDRKAQKGKDKKSYLKGFLGAFLGMLVGAVLWAALYALNIVASAAGFVTGWLANTLYDRFQGKKGKGKVAILVTVVILGVLLGTVLGLGVSLAIPILKGEWIAYWSLEDLPGMVLVRLITDKNIQLLVLRDMVLGLVFAALGVYTLLRTAARQVTGEKVTVLRSES